MPISQGLEDAIDEQAERVIIEGGGGDDTSKPDYVCPAHERMWKLARTVRDVYWGTDHMRTKGKTYLPQFEREPDAAYKKRLAKARLFNATRRTAEGLTGMVFRKDPILGEDVPKVIAEDHALNIDMAGRALPVFAKDLFTNGMVDGISFVHVDFPPVEPRKTGGKYGDARLGLRPFWTDVLLKDFINWQWEIVDGAPVLTLVVYREGDIEAVGDYGQRDVELYRVLRPGSFELWEKKSDAGKVRWEVVEEGLTSIPYIPFFPFYGRRTAFFEGEPPLLDLAHENIGHWELASERVKSRTIAHIPLLFMAGFPDDDKLTVSETNAFKCSDPSARVEWVVYEGQALAESRQDLKDIEARMAALGLSMLVRETRAAETAEAKTIDKSESDSALATAARAMEDCLESALQAHADFMPKSLTKGKGGTVTVNQNFREQEIDPQRLQVLKDMVAEGNLSVDTLWQIMQQGESLPEDFDPKKEKERIADMGLPEVDDLDLAA